MLRLWVVSGVFLFAFGPSPALAQASGTWTATGSMTTVRSEGAFTATPLEGT